MSGNLEQPLSRRAAREARFATGEQPSVAAPTDESHTDEVEDTTSSGPVVLGADGQPLTRRRLRELRATGVIPTISTASDPAEPVIPVTPALPYAPPAQTEARPSGQYFRPTVSSEPAQTTPAVPPAPEAPEAPEAPAATMRDTVPQPDVPASAFAPRSEPAPTGPSWTAPAGHWTRQLEVEDDLEMTASRQVGSSTSTASMLVVSELPKADLGSPLNETGQLLLTGSISLRPDYAATGAISNLHGEADFDDRFDEAHPITGALAAPVRATAVASQHALGTPIVAGGKARGSRAINVLLVTASVLAVLVTGLVVTAIVLGWI